MCEVNTSCHKTVQAVLIHQPREWEEKQRTHDRYNGVQKTNTREVHFYFIPLRSRKCWAQLFSSDRGFLLRMDIAGSSYLILIHFSWKRHGLVLKIYLWSSLFKMNRSNDVQIWNSAVATQILILGFLLRRQGFERPVRPCPPLPILTELPVCIYHHSLC